MMDLPRSIWVVLLAPSVGTLFPLFSFGQHTIQGMVVDARSQPIAYVAVEATAQVEGRKEEKYAITNEGGLFSMSVPAPGYYTLRARHLSYEEDSLHVEVVAEKQAYSGLSFMLFEKAHELDEIAIQDWSDVAKVKGDTLSYNLGAFTNGSERVLKDILNKLPGIEVDENGKIKANGKKIDKLLVDGQEFFGDNHAMATENLGAQMVGGVDLLNNYSGFDGIRGIEKKQGVALNINIKEGYKGRPTGDVAAATGHSKSYNLHSNLFRFDKKINFGLIADANNVGKQAISLQDFLSSNFDIRNDLKSDGLSSFAELPDLPPFLLSKEDVRQRNDQFAGINLTYMPQPKLKATAYGLFSRQQQWETSQTVKEFLTGQTGEAINSLEDVKGKGNFHFGQGKVQMGYKPNDDSYLHYSSIFELNKNVQEKDVDNQIFDKDRSLYQLLTHRPFSLAHQVSYVSRLADNKLLSLSAFNELENKAENLVLASSDSILLGVQTDAIDQNTRTLTATTGGLGKYTHKLTSGLLVRAHLGYTHEERTFESQSPIENFAGETLRFGIDYEQAALSMAKEDGIFQYLLQGEFKFVQSRFGKERQNKLWVLPKAKIKIEMKKTHFAELFYERQVGFAPLSYFNQKELAEDFITVYTKSFASPQTPFDRHIGGGRYINIDLYHGWNLFAFSLLSLDNTLPVQNSTFTSDGYNRTFYSTGKTGQRKWSNTLGFDNRLSKISAKLKLNASYALSSGPVYANGNEDFIVSHLVAGRAILSSRFEKPIFNYSIGCTFSNLRSFYRESSFANKMLQIEPFVQVEGTVSKNWNYQMRGALASIRTTILSRKLFRNDFLLSYRKANASWMFYLEAKDVPYFQNRELVDTTLANNITETRRFNTMRGYFLFGSKYYF